ncbi:MAG: fimbria/pilus outer membrane usher protein [Parasphingorhabdus sp.]
MSALFHTSASCLALAAAVFAGGEAQAAVPVDDSEDTAVLAEGLPASPPEKSPEQPESQPGGSAEQPASQPEGSIDDIFKRVFGKERPALGQDDYAILIEGVNVGEYLVTPDNGSEYGSVEADFVKTVLAPIVVDESSDQLKSLANGRDSVTFDQLREFGLQVEFDDAQLVLRIEVPASIRTIRNLNLRSLRNRSDIELVEQSDFSAYASIRAGTTVVEDSIFSETGFTRFVADMDFAVNVHGVAAELELRYDDSRDRKLSRGDFRLTYDDRDSLVRYEVGDLSVGRRPFQDAPRIAGISAFRNYNINPYLNIRPSPEQSFELDRPARVEVLLNGSPVRTYDLRSGRYNLRDFPLIPSAGNDIELRITYASGETELRSYPAFYDLELLAPGLVDFAANIGLPYRDDNGLRRYDDNNYNGTAYLRYGLSPALTVGVNWEGDRYFDLLGAEMVWASPIGTFGISSSTNIRDPEPDNSQLSLQYRWRDADVTRDRSIDASLILTGQNYRTLNEIFAGSFISKQARFRVGQKISPEGRLQFFGGYDQFRNGQRDSYYVGTNYSHQLSFGSVSASAEYRRSDDRSGPVLRVALSIPLGRSSLTSSYTTEDNAARVEYNRLASVGANSFGFSAGAERRDGSDRQFGRASYIGNRFEASVQQTARNYFSERDRDLRTEVTFGSALVMADGQFAISRPVRNSFAIFKANKKAGDYQIAVEPRTGFGSSKTSYSGYSGALGPAVVTTITPYFNRSLQVDAPDAPAGTSLGGQVFSLNPGYRSGYNIEVGNARNVSLVGNMVDRDGDPLVYVTGIARDASILGELAEVTQIFTNAKGRFFLEGVEAGRTYDITVTADGQTATEAVAIPEDVSGIYELKAQLAYDLDFEAEGEDDD